MNDPLDPSINRTTVGTIILLFIGYKLVTSDRVGHKSATF
jgi:hypothetical protein